MSKKQTTAAADPAGDPGRPGVPGGGPDAVPAPEYKVRVRFLKRTEACGGVFAGGSTARVRKSTADILVAEGFATIIGV